MRIKEDIDLVAAANFFVLVIGGIIAYFEIFGEPEVSATPPTSVIFYATPTQSGVYVPSISLDSSFFNKSMQEKSSVLRDAVVIFQIGETIRRMKWSASHKVIRSGKTLEFALVSLPESLLVPGNSLTNNRFGFVDIACLNAQINCIDQNDFKSLIRLVSENDESLINISYKFQNIGEIQLSCRIVFNKLDLILIMANNWIAKACTT